MSIPARVRRALMAGAIAVMAAGACETAPSPGSPSVVLSYVTSATCSPAPRPPGVPPWSWGCTLDLEATAKDPDGDPLQYLWSSQSAVPAQGKCVVPYGAPTQTRVRCQLWSPEQTITATVTVTDPHGLTASASLTVTGEGVNRPPEIGVSLHNRSFYPSPSPTVELLGSVTDKDEGVLCGGWQFRKFSVTGDCLTERFWVDSSCTSGVQVHVYRTAPAGMCVLTLEAHDSAGATASLTVPISYPPR